mmetsp:Transcript_7126/g.21741  ORF Transcript_7126/g.21741 Transcript_7126/m.21741 type:complete len:356 (-) Transcript_7126:128-1195(-)
MGEVGARADALEVAPADVTLLDLQDEILRVIMENFTVPSCNFDCSGSEQLLCIDCKRLCTQSQAWADTKALVAFSRSNKYLYAIAKEYVDLHRAAMNKLFASVSNLYLPHGCIRRGLNLPLLYALRNGEDPNARTVSLPCRWNYLGRGRALGTLLHYAVEFNNVEAIRILVRNGAETSIPDSHSWTPLHLAAAKGKVDCVHELLMNGADPNVGGGFEEDNSRGWCALHLAAVQADAEMIDLLLSHGADPGRGAGRFGDTPFHEFACTGSDINCFPGALRRATNDVKKAFDKLVAVTANGAGGLYWENERGFTPVHRANESIGWLFPRRPSTPILSHRERRSSNALNQIAVYSEVN